MKRSAEPADPGGSLKRSRDEDVSQVRGVVRSCARLFLRAARLAVRPPASLQMDVFHRTLAYGGIVWQADAAEVRDFFHSPPTQQLP